MASSSSSLFSSLLQRLPQLLNMGCVCAKETVLVQGQTYVVKEQIGEGGFSTIDLVEHARTRQQFALKKITCHSTEDQIAGQKEVEFHRHLNHPNILKLEASAVVGSADIVHGQTSQVLLLMPYFPHGTLHHRLERMREKKVHFSESEVLDMFLAICDGVQYMHDAKPNPLAHRDLKPHNVLLTRDLKPVVMDLGSTAIARVTIDSHAAAQRLQDEAAERSSITYRSPELFQVNSNGQVVDERTDVWSLGCLLYAMCFYHSPYDPVFERGDSVALAVQGSNALHFPVHSPYSTDLHNLITWMLTPDLNMRPHLAQIVARAKDMRENSVATPKGQKTSTASNGASAPVGRTQDV